MNVSRVAVFWALATLVLAAATAFLVASLVVGSSRGKPVVWTPAEASEESFHAWLHQNLKITEAQHDQLLPFEENYERERQRLREEIRTAGQELAAAIRQNQRDSAELAAALERLHRAQGELQQVTLDHFFIMKEHLSPEQAERLLEWTHDNIIHGYGY